MCNVQHHIYTHVAARPLRLRLKPGLRGDLRVIHTIKEERKRSGCCRFTHDTLGEKPFFFSPQHLTKNIFKNYSLLLTQRLLSFPCETLLLQYVYSIRCPVQYMEGPTLYCTGLASEQGCSRLPPSRLLRDREWTATKPHSSAVTFVLQGFFVFFFLFFFF